MNELALFAGAGGGILGTKLLGWRVVCAVEWDAYCREVLLRRQEEGFLEAFPIWDDVRTFDGTKWRGKVDVVTGGFPCQPFSVAGKQKGTADERNMWPETIRVIQEVRPQYVLLENVPGIQRYLPVVIRDLRRAGYTVKRPIELTASDVGFYHYRARLWIIGFNADGTNGARERGPCGENMVSPFRATPQTIEAKERWLSELVSANVTQRVTSYSGALRSLYGMEYRVDRLKALGNGQVPLCVKVAWDVLTNPL